jgi:hypothetical protein
MDIDDYTTKLICDYQDKISACDQSLPALRIKNRFLRREENKGYEERLHIILEIKALEAKRQAYVQAKIDIESIQDFMGI